MTTFVCFAGPIFDMFAGTAPKNVNCIAMDKKDFKQIVSTLKWAVENEFEHLVFVMGDLPKTVAIFRIIQASFFFYAFRRVTLIYADSQKPQWSDANNDLHLSVCGHRILRIDRFNDDEVYLPIHRNDWYKGEEKKTDISFYGTLNLYPERKETLEFLKGAGVNIHHEHVPNISKALCESKLTLNFGNCLSGRSGMYKPQIKGRVWEAMMAKCVVLERRNPEVAKLFTDDEIVFYDDMKELPSLIERLLSDYAWRDSIAEKAYQKAKKYADPAIYWERVLN